MRCFFGLHKWGEWTLYMTEWQARYCVMAAVTNHRLMGIATRLGISADLPDDQPRPDRKRRSCTLCGKTQDEVIG